MLAIVQDDLMSNADILLGLFRHRLPGVQVPVEAWEVAAGDMKANAMAFLEDVAGLPDRNLDLIGLMRR